MSSFSLSSILERKCKRRSLTRNGRSMLSLISLGTSAGGENSSTLSLSGFSHLATPKVILKLEELDDELGQIGSQCSSLEYPQNGISPSSSASNSGKNKAIVIERVERNDYQQVCLIGRGGYSDVYLVTNQIKNQNFALKSLNPKRIKNSSTLIVAATNLAMEAQMLNELHHENIIQLMGVCSTSLSQSFTEDTMDNGYFLILELITEVLSDRLETWQKDNNRICSFENKWLITKPKLNIKKMYGWMRNVALGIVKGMVYLHEKDILIRDLKPQNIGFNREGKVRLFDFGMARKLKDCNKNDMCGLPRYVRRG